MNDVKDWIKVVLFFGTIFAIVGLLDAWSKGDLDGTGIESLLSTIVPAIGVGFAIAIIVNMWDIIINEECALKGTALLIVFVVTTFIAYIYISTKPSEDEYLPILCFGMIVFFGTIFIRFIRAITRK